MDGGDGFLGGPIRLANAKVSLTEPSIGVRTGRPFLLESRLLFWKTRGYSRGRELRWSYGARSTAALKLVLRDIQLSPCCKVGAAMSRCMGLARGSQ